MLSEPALTDALAHPGVRSRLSAPLAVPGERPGFISLINKQTAPTFSAEDASALQAVAAYAALVAGQSMVVTVENSLKFDWLRPRGQDIDFSYADRLVDFATSRGLRLRGNALIWNDWLPGWLDRLSKAEVGAMMDRHIDEVVGRYAGRVQSWDIVNEPFFPMHGQAGGYRKGRWLEAMGPDYIARAFRRAALADPKAELVLNEAFTEQTDEIGAAIRPLLHQEIARLKAGRKLLALEYEIQPQAPAGIELMPAGASAGPYQVMGSRMRLSMSLLHEDDLLGFLDDLQDRVHALLYVRRCSIDRRTGSKLTNGMTPQLSAECEIDWITLKEKR